MATLKELKIRIGSVASSEKITGAMKMISSAKVHKEEQSLRRLMPFKNQIKSIMGHILQTGENFNSPLIESRDVKRVGIVVYGSDDGLCGAYNINIFKGLLIQAHRPVRQRCGDCDLSRRQQDGQGGCTHQKPQCDRSRYSGGQFQDEW